MLKNGSSISLQLIKIDNISYSFTLTSGVDSLTQAIACAAIENGSWAVFMTIRIRYELVNSC